MLITAVYVTIAEPGAGLDSGTLPHIPSAPPYATQTPKPTTDPDPSPDETLSGQMSASRSGMPESGRRSGLPAYAATKPMRS